MKINCIIIDDEKPARKLIRNYCERLEWLTVVEDFKSPLDAVALIQKGNIDAIFLDIRMPEISGIDFIKSLTIKPKVILTTAYRDYALEGFELDVLDYLLKPIEFHRFLKAVNKLKKQIPQSSSTSSQDIVTDLPKTITIKSSKKIYKVEFSDIYFIKSDSEYITYYTKSYGKIMVHGALKNIETQLIGSDLIKIHRSHLVNLKYVDYVEGNSVFIQDQYLSISDTYKSDFLDRWQ